MRQFLDRDHDIWYMGSDGELYEIMEDAAGLSGIRWSVQYVRDAWGPLTELAPSPTDLSAPATRGDLVKVLHALAMVAEASPEAAARYASDLADEIKEGRA